VDAIATPFVQGRLRRRRLAGTLRTQCAHCAEPLEVAVDSDLGIRVRTPGARPLVSTPFVNLKRLKDRTIIDAF